VNLKLRKVADKLKGLVTDERGITVVEGFLYTAVAAGITYSAVSTLGANIKNGAASLGTSLEGKMTPSWP